MAVLGPNFKEGVDTKAIADVVLPFDEPNSPNRLAFQEYVVDRMRSGMSFVSEFNRTIEKPGRGGTAPKEKIEQEFYMTSAPVTLRSLRAIDHTDFSAGVEARSAPVYSLGFGIATKDLAIAFEEVVEKVNEDIDQVTIVSILLIVGALLMVM